MPFINRRTKSNAIETMGAFTHDKAEKMLHKYQLADPSAYYYLSVRCTVDFADEYADLEADYEQWLESCETKMKEAIKKGFGKSSKPSK